MQPADNIGFYCPFTLAYQYWCMAANMKKHKTEVYQVFNDPDNTMLKIHGKHLYGS